MAIQAITNAALTAFNTTADFPAAVAASVAADGVTIDATGRDDKLLIYIENTDSVNAESAIIKKGNGIQAANDLTVSLAASAKKVIQLESGAFKNVSGTNKGKILIIPSSTDVKFSAILMK
ncbi:hypothetical protein SDC9_129706 [bioreactor metagenome]|uniref:Uncharacterized protein n=1 Tax=bioreactor metagenome TaxID=1076179 RepID=A0A645D0A4_9ZZZZ|nr:hypothetical protein [Oscillospiraceae bacterium]